MIDVKVGDRVRCTDANPAKYRDILPKRAYSDHMDGLQVGKVYTVRSVEMAYVQNGLGEDKEIVDLMGIKVDEIVRCFCDIPFGASRFEIHVRK